MSGSIEGYLSRHMTAERSREVNEILDGLPEPDGDIFEILEEAEYEAVRRTNPAMPPFSYLVIRLSGESVDDGGINHDVANDILGPISAEIQAAADKRALEAEITLVRITQGSLVLHYQPKRPLASVKSDQIDIAVSPVDQAVRDTFELHNMLERGELPAVIASRFGENKRLLKTARKLTEALDKHDLNMGGKWRSPTGGRVESKLSQTGRTYARGVFLQIDKPAQDIVSGRITGLDLDGIVTVQQVNNRKRRVHLSEPSDITAGGFTLGAEVHLVVEKLEARDQVGLGGREYLSFVDHVRQDEMEIPLN